MRILIYNESAEGKALSAEFKEKGHKASVISSDESQFDPKQPDPCDEVHTWHSFIVHAYSERFGDKVAIHYHGPTITEEDVAKWDEPEVKIEEVVEPVKIVRKRR